MSLRLKVFLAIIIIGFLCAVHMRDILGMFVGLLIMLTIFVHVWHEPFPEPDQFESYSQFEIPKKYRKEDDEEK